MSAYSHDGTRLVEYSVQGRARYAHDEEGIRTEGDIEALISAVKNRQVDLIRTRRSLESMKILPSPGDCIGQLEIAVDHGARIGVEKFSRGMFR